jgi:thiol-disulfide isomerase/thioredoxin
MRRKAKLVIFSVLMAAVIGFCFYKSLAPAYKQNTYVTEMIGRKLSSFKLLDSNHLEKGLDLLSDSLTIVDFWFGECAGCLQEMKQFDQLLRASKSKVSIVSISINSFNNWKGLFASDKSIYSFLKTKNEKWKHFVLKSDEDPRLHNDIPMDNYNLIMKQFNTYSYPVYFVVNSEEKIIATPNSAVDYIKSLE